MKNIYGVDFSLDLNHVLTVSAVIELEMKKN